MGGKRKDYEGMISVYHNLTKQRPLTTYEEERLIELVCLEKRAKHDRAYKDRNRVKLNEKKRQWFLTERGRELSNKACRKSYWKNPEARRQKWKEWARNNPEKYAEQLKRKAAAREAKRQEESK